MMASGFDLQIVETRDGSLTLRDGALGATYRSERGAAGESEHVFVNGSGLRELKDAWNVFELGFGGGRNCLQTIAAFLDAPLVTELQYTTVDYEPIPLALFDALYLKSPYASLAEKVRNVLLHQKHSESVYETQLSPDKKIILKLLKTHWAKIPHGACYADAVYHDPFGPRDNPDAWSEACFKWQASQLKPSGRLVTYSAASASRYAMRSAGLVVARGPGYGGKREMTIAAKERDCLKNLSLWKENCSEQTT